MMHYFGFSLTAVGAAAAETLRGSIQAKFDSHVADMAPEPHSEGTVVAAQNCVDSLHYVTGAIRCTNDHSASLKSDVTSVCDSAPSLVSELPVFNRHNCTHDESAPTLCVDEVF